MSEPTYITLRVDSPEEADDLLRDMQSHPGSYILTPTQENIVSAAVESATRGGQPYTPPELDE